MNRRKAIWSIFILGGGAVATFGGYEWFNIRKQPDLAFLDQHKMILADLTDVIIPRTDTPGAKDVMAHDMVIHLLKNCSDRKTQNNFINGLSELIHYTNDKFKKDFTALSAVEKHSVCEIFYKKSKTFTGKFAKARNKIMGKSFFDTLKEYTTIAFCTSKQGATQTLAYDYIPGKYVGCTPLTANQRSWATK